MKDVGTAPGKVILVGEHAVVYGIPAIALPVSSVRANVTVVRAVSASGIAFRSDRDGEVRFLNLAEDTLDPIAQMVRRTLEFAGTSPPDLLLTLESAIPVAGGMGSGAAVSTAVGRALAAALGFRLADEQLNQLVYEVEKLHHGTPSGIDNTVVVYETPIFFQRDCPIAPLSVLGEFVFLIAHTGVAASTKVVVEDVRRLHGLYPAFVAGVFSEIAEIVRAARDALRTGDVFRLGALMSANHSLLQSLTVSSSLLDKLVLTARDAGALGAKLSGGGRGGNMIALVSSADVDAVSSALLSAGAVRVVKLVLS